MSYTLAYTGAEIDALLGKIDAIFVAEYGSTIYSEVTAAIAAGNKVIVANAGKVYVYAGQDDNSGYVFTQSGPNAAKPNATYVTLSTGNVWSTATVDLATLQQFYASLMEDTASGSIASFPDGAEGVPVKELTADIEPIQDLHGQASPYPEGGYVNKYPILVGADSWVDNSQATHTNNNGTLVVTVPAGRVACGVYTISPNIGELINSNLGYPSTVSFSVYATRSCTLNTGFSTPGRKLIPITTTKQRVSYTINSALSGAFVFYVDAADYDTDTIFYISDMQVESGSTASPYAPYSNICPISGYTGAEITRTGDNLYAVGNFIEHSYLGDDGTITYTGNQNAVVFAKCKPNTVYTFSKNAGIRFRVATTTEPPKIGTPFASLSNYDGSTSHAYTTGATAEWLVAWVYNYSDGDMATMLASITINEGSTALLNEPQGTTYSVSWSDHGTIYKGTAQYKGGGEWEITPTYGFWSKTWSEGVDATQLTNVTRKEFAGFGATFKNASDSICNLTANYNTGYTLDEVHFYIASNGNPWVFLPNGTDGSTVIQICYPLLNPTTFTVTGPDPSTLLGDNNIWSDTGDISVKYKCNTALYIEKKLG